jgi:acyl-CoA synthetase (NDP forming)
VRAPSGGEFPDAEDLRPLLRPRGIAVVGASADPGKFSGRLVPALLRCGYAGGIYPVNPRHAELGGRPCYPSVAEVPEPCDLAIVAVPARHVVEAVAQAAARGVGAAVVLSGGFGEIGGEGGARAGALAELRGRIRIYGPNCPGLWQVADGLVYTFSAQFDPAELRPGPVGLVTQGGALGRALLDAMETGLGFSYWFSTGNEADLDVADFVAFLADEPRTRVVAVLAEGLRDGRRFLRAAERCRAAGKPLALLKIAASAEGARSALRHTAAPNGDPGVAEALLRGAGCLLADDVDELADLAGLLARYPRPAAGGGLGICSFSGGAGVLLADRAAAAGAPLAALRPETVRALGALLPEIAAVGNPTDLTTAVLEDPALARRALEAMAADPGVAMVLFPLPHRLDAFDEAMARHLAEAAAGGGKPVAVVAISPAFDRERAAAVLREAGVPVFGSARRAALAAARWLGAPPRTLGATPRPAAFADAVFGPVVVRGSACRLAPLTAEEAGGPLQAAGAAGSAPGLAPVSRLAADGRAGGGRSAADLSPRRAAAVQPGGRRR